MAEFTINTWQDRQLNDNELFNQFITYWQSGEYQLALDILDNNAQLSSKSFIAGSLNIIGAALTYLQNNYFDNVEDVLAQDLIAFNLALSRFVNQHDYVSTQQYYINNFVLYNNLYYMCIQDSLDNLPTDTNYWVLIGLKGSQGAAGTGLNLKYTWSASTNYAQYDVVYLSGKLYVALQPNINQNPITATTYWELFMEVPVTSITISESVPVEPYEGQIWAKILT